MDSGRTFPPRRSCVITLSGDTGTKWERPCGLAVEPRRRKPRRDREGMGQLKPEFHGVDWQEKPDWGVRMASVP